MTTFAKDRSKRCWQTLILDAIAELTQLTAEGPISFLLNQMSGFEDQPPADWDGAFSLTSK